MAAFRSGGFLILLIAVVAAAASASRAAAGTSASDFIEPVVTHVQFTVFSRKLDLAYEQRMIAELLFSDYTDAMAALARRADAEADALPGGGRQRVLDAFAGRAVVNPVELANLRLAVLDVYQGVWPLVDRYLSDLFEGVRSILTDDQRPLFQPAMVELRRTMLLHPREAARSSYEYAGDGVDVMLLVDEARRAELDGLASSDGAASLQQIKSTYEQHLDAVLDETLHAHREARMAARTARIRRDEAQRQEAEEALLEVWRRLYDLNEWTARQVADIAEASLGEAAARQWNDRFRRACFPWLFSRGVPDRQYEWLAQQQLTEEQSAGVEEIYHDYLARRAELLVEAQELMLTSRRELKRIVYPMMDPSDLSGALAKGMHERLLKNSGQLAGLEAATSDRFESVLTEQQRLNMRRAIRFGSRRW